MLSLILAEKIASLFLVMAMGFAIAKSGVVNSKNIVSLSLVSLYVINPCMIITAFQVDLTPEVESGFFLALVAGFILQIVFIVLIAALGRAFHFNAVEKTAIVYSNAGNLIIPLVVAALGSDWVIYCTAWLIFQTFLLWSHGRSVLEGKRGIDWRRILLSINMIAVYIGIVLFFTGLRLPGPLYDGVKMVGDMIGPVAMLITGIIMGGLDFKQALSYKRLPLVVFFRLVVLPLVAVAFLKFSGIAAFSPNGTSVLLVTLLAASSPSASTINQMAQIYDCDAQYASSINVMTTLFCIATMPLVVMLYQL